MADLSLSVGRPGLKQESLLPILDTLSELYHTQQSLPATQATPAIPTLEGVIEDGEYTIRQPLLAETTNMDLRSLLEVLFRAGGIEAVKDFFTTHAYRVTQPFKGTRFESTVVSVKYIDGLNNLWKPKWAREARGRVYFYDVAEERVYSLKDSLPRGAEVLTGVHTKATITETQDLSLDAYSHLDPVQQQCITTFLKPEGAPLVAHLSGKVDGSLLLVTVYAPNTRAYTVMKEIVEECGDPFAKELAKACGNGPLLVVATQGTLLIADIMQDYFLTGLQSLLGPVKKPLQSAWAHFAPLFVTTVLDYLTRANIPIQYQQSQQSPPVTLCFEVYCKNRRTLTGTFHPELAVNYDTDGMNLLGVMVDGAFRPHFTLPATLFSQPLSLPIQSTTTVFRILEDMDRVVRGEMPKATFLATHGFPEDAPLHMEGWVLLTPQPDGTYDYAKIKTPLYYQCHKIHSYNVPALLALPTACDATYPILAAIRVFYNKADARIQETLGAIGDLLEIEAALGPASAFYEALPTKARDRFTAFLDDPTDEKRDTLFRILMNAVPVLFRQRMIPILRDVWEVEAPPDAMVSLFKSIVTKHAVWRQEVPKDVVANAKKDLYSILVESLVPA